MSERESLLTGEEWTWLHHLCPEEGCCVIFARGVTPEQMIASFGMDPGTAELIDPDVGPPSGYPVWDEQGNLQCPIIQAGRSGEWAFAIDSCLASLDGSHGSPLSLPDGGEAVQVQWTQTIDGVDYWSADGRSASFDPGMDDPEIFLAEAGLEIDAAEQVDFDEARYAYLAALDMMKLAIGLDVPATVAEEPLLWCQRPPAGTGS